jgi:hypothetical protein
MLHQTDAFPDEKQTTVDADSSISGTNISTNAVISIATDKSLLAAIKSGYTEDEFCKHVATTSMAGWQHINGLWYIANCLLIPRVGNVRKLLFRAAHDDLGHFGADKSYASLRDAYYWPNMCRDLEEAYIPSCIKCLRNKSLTIKPPGPLHPLPVPDQRGSDITMDFVSPLPVDNGFDCLLTITDRIGSDVRIIPTNTNITADTLALLFFDNWYCKNGLPATIACDRDKLFVSCFWNTLTKLTGIKLKMSSAYHPETNGSSERSNKTINQMLCFHVKRSQKGWVRALPRIRFQIMNMVNASTGFSGFQLHMGRSPHIIPPLVPSTVDLTNTDTSSLAAELITRVNNDVADAHDNLLLAKITQAHHTNKSRAPDPLQN